MSLGKNAQEAKGGGQDSEEEKVIYNKEKQECSIRLWFAEALMFRFGFDSGDA